MRSTNWLSGNSYFGGRAGGGGVLHTAMIRSRIASELQHDYKQHILDTEVLGQVFGTLKKLEALEVNIVGPLSNRLNAETIFLNNYLKDSEDDFEKVRDCSALLRALRDTKLQLQCLKFRSLPVRFFEQKPIATRRLQGALGYLEALFLTTYLRFARYSNGSLFSKNFGLFLRSAPRLKKLRICLASRIDRKSQLRPVHFSITSCMGYHLWPSMQSFQLIQAIVHGSQLIKFLGRHAGTLVRLESKTSV